MAQQNVAADFDIPLSEGRAEWEMFEGGEVSSPLPWDGLVRFRVVDIVYNGVSAKKNHTIKVTLETAEEELGDKQIGGITKVMPVTGIKEARDPKYRTPLVEGVYDMLASGGRSKEEVMAARAQGNIKVSALKASMLKTDKNAAGQPKNIVYGEVSHTKLRNGKVSSSIDNWKTEKTYVEAKKANKHHQPVQPREQASTGTADNTAETPAEGTPGTTAASTSFEL